MYEVTKPQLITAPQRRVLESDPHRRLSIELTENFLQNVDSFIQLNLKEHNSIYLNRAEENMGRALSRIRRTVNDPAFPIDKGLFLDKAAFIIEGLYSPELEERHPDFVEEYIYGPLFHDLPALRAQFMQCHEILEPIHM